MNINELRVKMMISCEKAAMVGKKEKFPCSVCGKSVGSNFISPILQALNE